MIVQELYEALAFMPSEAKVEIDFSLTYEEEQKTFALQDLKLKIIDVDEVSVEKVAIIVRLDQPS